MREYKTNARWKQARSFAWVQGSDVKSQFDFLKSCLNSEVLALLRTKNIYSKACHDNGQTGYGPVEADFLYAFILAQKPKKIAQIGCGVSTAVILEAANAACYAPKIVCVEPYPNLFIKSLNRQSKITLIEQKAEDIALEQITSLVEGDLLFVDSTHTVKPGNEVSRIILEILPRLRREAWVHFHDIYFPYDYPRNFLTSELFFGHESVLLHAFLIENPRYAIAASLSMLHYADPEGMKTIFPRYLPAKNDSGLAVGEKGDFPSSLYLRVVK